MALLVPAVSFCVASKRINRFFFVLFFFSSYLVFYLLRVLHSASLSVDCVRDHGSALTSGREP